MAKNQWEKFRQSLAGVPEAFDYESFAQAQGLPTKSPTGRGMPEFGSWDAFSNFIRSEYGMSPQDFIQSTPEARYGGYAGQRGIATSMEDIPIDPTTGMAARPPQSPQEAALFQFQAGQETMRKGEEKVGQAETALSDSFEMQREENAAVRARNRELLNSSVSTLRYMTGLLRKGGPYALQTLKSPVMQQMAQTYMAGRETPHDYMRYGEDLANLYSSVQYREPDYSFYTLPIAYPKPGSPSSVSTELTGASRRSRRRAPATSCSTTWLSRIGWSTRRI
jgi:hypothetical protein